MPPSSALGLSLLKPPRIAGVVITAPAALHYEIAEKALQAGKHVFVEKPLSLTRGDGEKLVRLAAERQKTLFVGHMLSLLFIVLSPGVRYKKVNGYEQI